MTDFTLYCFAESGNSYKVALYLEMAQLDWKPKHVRYFEGETESEDFRSGLNVQGECPVLNHNGQVFTQSGAILTYLVNKIGKFGWENETQQYEILRWLLFDNHKLTSNLATYRYGYSVHPGVFDETVLEFVRNRTLGALSIVDQALSRHQFIAKTNNASIADLSMAAYLLYPPEEYNVDLESKFPSVARWLTDIRNLQNWKSPYELMPGKQ